METLIYIKENFNTSKITGQIDWLGLLVLKNDTYDIKHLTEEISV